MRWNNRRKEKKKPSRTLIEYSETKKCLAFRYFFFFVSPFFSKMNSTKSNRKEKWTRLLASNLLFSARKWRNIKGFRFSLNTRSLFSKFISDLVFGQWPSSSVFISAFLKSQFQKIKNTFFLFFWRLIWIRSDTPLSTNHKKVGYHHRFLSPRQSKIELRNEISLHR